MANSAPILDNSFVRVLEVNVGGNASPVNGGYFVSDLFFINGNGSSSDADGDLLGIAVTGVSGITGGTVEISTDGGFTWVLATQPVSETNALLIGAGDLLRYTPPTGETGARTISFHAWDGTGGYISGDYVDLTSATGGENPFSVEVAQHTLNIVDVPSNVANSAPILDNSFVRVLEVNAGGEATPVNGGYFVSDQFFLNGNGSSSDADGDLLGIAVTGVSGITGGTVEISTDGGFTWVLATQPVSETNALLIGAGDLLRYTPPEGEFGFRTISFHAWDGTGGYISGQYVDLTSATGGENPFSVEVAQHTLNIVDVPANQAPLIYSNTAPEANIPVNSAPIIVNGNSFTQYVSYDVNGDPLGIAITNVAGLGTVEISNDGGITWEELSQPVSETHALLVGAFDLIRYTVPPDQTGDRTITYHAWDGTGGFTTGEYVDLTNQTDGANPFSTGTAKQTLHVRAVELVNSIEDQVALQGQVFSYTIPTKIFTNYVSDSPITYSVKMSDGSALPSWLKFDSKTNTISGTPTLANAGKFDITVTASNGLGSDTDTFTLSSFALSEDIDALVTYSDYVTSLVANEDYSINFKFATQQVKSALNDEASKIKLIANDQNLVSESLNAAKTQYSETFKLGEDTLTATIKGTNLGKLFGTDVSTGTTSITSISFSAPNDHVSLNLGTTGSGITLNLSTGAYKGNFTNFSFITPWLEVKAIGAVGFDSNKTLTSMTNFALVANFTELSVAYPENDYKVLLKGAIAYSQDKSGFANYSGNITELQLNSPYSDLSYKGALTYKGASDGSHSVTGQVSEITLTGIDNVNFKFTGDIKFSADGKLSGMIKSIQYDANNGHNFSYGGSYILDSEHIHAANLNLNILTIFNEDGTAKDINGDGHVGLSDLRAAVLSGNDLIYGSSNYEAIDAGAGDDIIDGGAVSGDLLTGGQGRDTFVLHADHSVYITDYDKAAGDVLDISGVLKALNITGTPNIKYEFIDNSEFGYASYTNISIETLGQDGQPTFVKIAILEDFNPGQDFTNTPTYITDTTHRFLATDLVAVKSDTLNGTTEDDYLSGGAGADNMTGKAGNDVYVVDNAGDKVVEVASGGTDEVHASITYTLGNDVENLKLIGDGLSNLKGTGNANDNILIGDAGNNQLDGAAGKDTLAGGFGDDTYIVDNANDLVNESAEQGNDTVRITFGATSYTLNTNVENGVLESKTAKDLVGNASNNQLTGNGSDNSLSGLAGNDTLNGLTGKDTLIGDTGNDTFIIDGADDVVTELINEGIDTIQTSLKSYSLVDTDGAGSNGGNVENLVLTGAALNGTGNALDNKLVGNSGKNILDGGVGADTLIGDAGDDTYIVDSFSDSVIETASGGSDEVRSTAEIYQLAGNIEKLTLLGSQKISGIGNASNNTITGNSADNFIDGNDGNDTVSGGAGNDSLTGGTGNDAINGDDQNDTLDGGVGKDTLTGGNGDDLYLVDDTADVVKETSATGGHDKVESAITLTLGNFVEDLTLSGFQSINGTGNALDNIIKGNSGSNLLSGGAGNDQLFGDADDSLFDGDDTLDGGTGSDTLIGGAGNDRYLVDLVTKTVKGGSIITIADSIQEDVGLDHGVDTVVFNKTTIANLTRTINLTDDGEFVGIENIDASQTGATKLNLIGTNTGSLLIGNDANNAIQGGDGDDTLDGGKGDDTLEGGAGNDVYTISSTKDQLNDTGGEDTIQAAFTLSLQNVSTNTAQFNQFGGFAENLTLLGTAAINATGNDAANVLIGNDGSNILDGKEGEDSMYGGKGADKYIVDNTSDLVLETLTLAQGGGEDTIEASVNFDLGDNVENLILKTGALIGNGNNLNNKITGNDDDNVLDGQSGKDTLSGGLGDDTYVVDNAGDVVTEALSLAKGGGTDTVQSYISYTLGQNLENLVLNGVDSNINGTGNADNNIITGNDGNNNLLGMAGDDSLSGGVGNDTLTGGVGIDNLDGGAGDDTYFVDLIASGTGAAATASFADNIQDDEGVDTLKLTGGLSLKVATLVQLGDNSSVGDPNILTRDLSMFENLDVSGTKSTLLNLVGNENNNVLIGNDANNSIDGGSGDDVLDGGSGNDTLTGGDGSDTYTLSAKTDVVIELAESLGTDTIQVKFSYSLEDTDGAGSDGGNVENLVLLGNAAINATGNSLQNRLVGNDGANTLNGLEDADTMEGGKGDDTYYVDDQNDLVYESYSAALGGGKDTVIASVSFSLDFNVDNLTLVTTDFAFRADGNELNNIIKGNANNNELFGYSGNDSLSGGVGDDILYGGLGNDTLAGDAGDDTFIFDSLIQGEKDTVQGFNVLDDHFELNAISFEAIGDTLDATEFKIGTAAQDADDYIIFNKATGALLYDADGNGAFAAIQFATLTGVVGTLTADSFTIGGLA